MGFWKTSRYQDKWHEVVVGRNAENRKGGKTRVARQKPALRHEDVPACADRRPRPTRWAPADDQTASISTSFQSPNFYKHVCMIRYLAFPRCLMMCCVHARRPPRPFDARARLPCGTRRSGRFRPGAVSSVSSSFGGSCVSGFARRPPLGVATHMYIH